MEKIKIQNYNQSNKLMPHEKNNNIILSDDIFYFYFHE